MTNWNGTPISYDLNGNMLSDGANTFSWNARNQVATLNSVSLLYDAFGRRIRNLQNRSFLFDGANAVQELSGSTVTANLISGGIDEIVTRTASTGSFTQLKDALGSTIGLVDVNGNVPTSYAYDPFGNTTVSGAPDSNGFQYTGRENEGNGLYFYRARYYSPLLGRFISEDPIGLGGGVNFYKYAGDDPILFYDPSGLDYSVSQTDGTTITVDVPITMYGAGANNALAGKWSQQISSMWNGHTWKGCNVIFNPIFTVDPTHESWLTATSSPGNNYVYVNQSYMASQTSTRAMLVTGYKFGDWWQSATRIEIVHDFGHLLDLDDKYDLTTGKPFSGFENDVMAMENEVSQFDLNNILAGRACGCQTKRNFHFGH